MGFKYGSPGGASSSNTPWTPSVTYLLVLVFVEITVMGVLRRYTKHGG